VVFPGSFQRKIYFRGEAVKLTGKEGFEAARDVEKAGLVPQASVAEGDESLAVEVWLARALTGDLFVDEFRFIEDELVEAEGDGVERGAWVGWVRVGFGGFCWV
jgi:hypothetical protein